MRRGGDDLEGGAEGVESSGGQLGGAGGELQQTGQLFLSEAGHHGPEPLHHLRDRRNSDAQTRSLQPSAAAAVALPRD